MFALHLLFWAVAEQMGQAQLRVLGCGRSQEASLFLVSHGVWVPGSAPGHLANAHWDAHSLTRVSSFSQAVHSS